MAIAHQAGEFENAQMLGYRGLRDTGSISQRPHGLFAVATQPFENSATGGVREGLEENV
jgi:hypothetical protein